MASRLDARTLLDNGNRALVLAAVAASPGIGATALQRRLGVGRKAVLHHLRVLEAHGLVGSARAGRYLGFHLRGAGDGVDVRTRLLLRPPLRAALARLLVDAPGGLTQGELAEQLPASRRLVCYHVGRLRALGLVDPTPRPRATQALRAALETAL